MLSGWVARKAVPPERRVDTLPLLARVAHCWAANLVWVGATACEAKVVCRAPQQHHRRLDGGALRHSDGPEQTAGCENSEGLLNGAI